MPVILLRLCLVYYVSRHRVPVGSEVLEIFDRAMRRLGYSGSCRVWVSSGTLGPFAFGTFRPTVMVPVQMMDSFSKDESELVFAHEIAHLRNQDSLWQPLINLVTLIFWWHPAVWWGRRNLLNAGEFAADARVVNAALNPVSLAECLIKFGHRVWARNRLSLLFQNGAAFHSALGKRIERLLKRPAPEEDLREIRRIGISSGSVVLIASCYFAVSRMVFPGLADANSLGETILAAAEPAEVVPIPIESVAVDSTEQDEKGLREGLESLASESSERDLLGEELVEEEKKAVNEVGGLTPAEYERFSKKSEIELLSMPSRVTRRFRLDPERAKDAFARFSNSSPDDFHDVRSDLQSKIRAVFRGAGINIPKSDEILDDQSHSFIFYNQENGLLFTRVLPSELDRLAEIVASINESPPQVFLDVRIAEVRDKSRQMLEERFPGFVGGGTTDSDALPQRTIDESLSSAISETLMGFSDCDLLAAPRVTTLSGRAAEISTTESRTIVFPERFEGSDEAPLLLDEPNDLAVRMKDGVVLTREVRVGLTTRILPSVRVSGRVCDGKVT